MIELNNINFIKDMSIFAIYIYHLNKNIKISNEWLLIKKSSFNTKGFYAAVGWVE